MCEAVFPCRPPKTSRPFASRPLRPTLERWPGMKPEHAFVDTNLFLSRLERFEVRAPGEEKGLDLP